MAKRCSLASQENLISTQKKCEIEFFLLFIIEENKSYRILLIKSKMLFLAKIIAFLNFENTFIYITRADLKLFCMYLNIAIFGYQCL